MTVPSPRRRTRSGNAGLRAVCLAGAFVGAACGIGACRGPEVQSHWRTRDIHVDGHAEDWSGLLSYVEDVDADVGFANDNEALYLCIVPHAIEVERQMMARGLVLWVNDSGKEERHWGVRFPLAVPSPTEPMAERRRLPQSEADRQAADERFQSTLTHLEIVSGEDTMRLTREEARPLEIGLVRLPSRTFVYEVRLPMGANDPRRIAVGVTPGSVLGVGLETAAVSQPMPPGAGGPGGRPGGGGPDGGGPPGGAAGGGPPGRGGGHGPGGGHGRPSAETESFEIWARVHLAVEPFATPATQSSSTPHD